MLSSKDKILQPSNKEPDAENARMKNATQS